MQRERDAAEGLNTAGFVSGYRGSPLGGLDENLWKAKKHLEAHHVQFVPGVNEDLAATAVWGSQTVDLIGPAKYDGVFAMWYGKGPGVDRCGDVFKHMNHAGTSQARRRAAGGRRRPRRLLVDPAAPVRPPVLGLDDPGPVSMQRAGIPRPRHPRLGHVALLRLHRRLQGAGRHGRIVGLDRRRPVPRHRQDPAGLPDAGRRPECTPVQHPAGPAGAQPGSADAGL